MKAKLRIAIKELRRKKNLKILLARTLLGIRQYFMQMNGKDWPADGRPVSLTKILTALRKSLVKAVS